MANKKNIDEIEFEYRATETSRERRPIVELRIVTPFKTYPNDWLEAVLDTGYDGGLIVPLKLYKEAELEKAELPVEYWDVGESLTGDMMLLQAALANIEIKGLDNLQELRIETFKGNEEVVLGLNGINVLFLCLDGPNGILRIKK
jgi:predicted aspartyl protease